MKNIPNHYYKPSELKHILFIGNTGSGKSSLINALSGANLAIVGNDVDPQTVQIKSYRISQTPYIFWDSPGLSKGIEEDKKHISVVNKLLLNRQMHRIVLVVEAGKKDLGTTYKIIKNIVNKSPSQSIIIAVNQVGIVNSRDQWNNDTNEPSPSLKKYIAELTLSVRRRIIESTNIEIAYTISLSAKKCYKCQDLWSSIA